MTHLLRAESIDGSFRPSARLSVASVELDGESVLLDEETGHTHLLNPTATVVWQSFDGQTTINALVDDLAEAFGIDRAVVYEDVLNLVRQLGQQGLLHGIAAETSVAPEAPAIDDDECAD